MLPVFFAFLFVLMQVGHACMIKHLLQHACRAAARMGSTEGVTTTDVESKVLELAGTLVDPTKIRVYVKDASIYDSGVDPPASWEQLANLPAIADLSTAETQQLFLVQAEVDYNDVALLPLPFTQHLKLAALAFMRHE